MSLIFRITILAVALGGSGCISIVRSNEQALFVSASKGVDKSQVGPGTYWHLPWNGYVKYDLRWKQKTEKIDIQTRDGLHLTLDVTTVVRPKPGQLAELDSSVGPDYYEQVIRPALFATVRSTGGDVIQRQLVRHTHELENAIKATLIERLRAMPIEISEVAVQHFDLPDELKEAANRTAASEQLIAAKEVELAVAERDVAIDLEKRRAAIAAQGMERTLKAEQDVAAAKLELELAEAHRKVEREKATASAELLGIKAEGEARATVIAAEAERKRLQSASGPMSEAYVRLRSLELLAQAMMSGTEKLVVVPSGGNGFPGFFSAFMNPFSPLGK